MMNENRETMIERYLDGTMAPSERADFTRRMSSDPDLRRSVGAEQVIRSAVRGDASHTPSPASRDRFLSMLAAVSAEFPAPANHGANASPGGSSPLQLIKGSRRAKMIRWGVGGVALIIAVLLLLPRPDQKPEVRTAAPASATQPLTPRADAPPSNPAPAPSNSIQPAPSNSVQLAPSVNTATAGQPATADKPAADHVDQPVGESIRSTAHATTSRSAAEPHASHLRHTTDTRSLQMPNDPTRVRIKTRLPDIHK